MQLMEKEKRKLGSEHDGEKEARCTPTSTRKVTGNEFDGLRKYFISQEPRERMLFTSPRTQEAVVECK